MRLLQFEIDDSFYPISRRRILKIFGVPIWSKSYIMAHIGNGEVVWIDLKGNVLR